MFSRCLNKIPCVFPVFEQNSLCFPGVLITFPNSLCFPDREFFLAIFPVFPVPLLTTGKRGGKVHMVYIQVEVFAAGPGRAEVCTE